MHFAPRASFMAISYFAKIFTKYKSMRNTHMHTADSASVVNVTGSFDWKVLENIVHCIERYLLAVSQTRCATNKSNFIVRYKIKYM